MWLPSWNPITSKLLTDVPPEQPSDNKNAISTTTATTRTTTTSSWFPWNPIILKQLTDVPSEKPSYNTDAISTTTATTRTKPIDNTDAISTTTATTKTTTATGKSSLTRKQQHIRKTLQKAMPTCDIDNVCGDNNNPLDRDLIAHKATEAKELAIKEQRLLRAILILVVVMNVPYLRFMLYPFMIFSTWVHEMCHAIGALLCGGGVSHIVVNKNGSGVAYTYLSGNGWYLAKRVVVSSAGYMGTAIVGGVLLLFRRTKKGPRVGVIAVGVVILLSCMFWLRNTWGLLFMTPMGLILMLAGWFLPQDLAAEVFAFLAITCCLNAVTSIDFLFDLNDGADSDAHTVEKLLYLPYWFWAAYWFGFSILCCFLGIVFGVDADGWCCDACDCGGTP